MPTHHLALLALISCTAVSGCFDLSAEPYGNDGELCFREGTCNGGLVCKDGLCAPACGPSICSGHGVCSFDVGVESCACDQGYEVAGTECIGLSVLRFTHVATGVSAVDVYIAGDAAPSAVSVEPATSSVIRGLGPASYRIELRSAGLPVSALPLLTSAGFSVGVRGAVELIFSGALRPDADQRGLGVRPYAPAESQGFQFVHGAQGGAVNVSIDGFVAQSEVQPQETRTLLSPSGESVSFIVVDSSEETPLLERTPRRELLTIGRTVVFFSNTSEQFDALSLPPLPATVAEPL